jgi:hypothetical protein
MLDLLSANPQARALCIAGMLPDGCQQHACMHAFHGLLRSRHARAVLAGMLHWQS